MTIDTLIMLSGTLVALLPFLGFPASWDTVILVVIGFFVVSLGIVVRRKGERLYRLPLKPRPEMAQTQTTE